MKRSVLVTLCLLISLTVALPAFSQGGENNDWQAIQDQRDTRQQAALIETFIGKYSSSPHRPDADKMLISYWASNKDYAKIVNHADNFKQSLPSADAASKAAIYTQAMIAAASLNNLKKTVEMGGLALAADPTNFTVMSFLASSNLLDANTTLDYATKAAALPKPATMTDAQYETWIGRMEGLLGLAALSQNKFKDAAEHYEKALKANPKDHANQFRYGFANLNLIQAVVQSIQAASDDYDRARIATPVVQADVDAAKAKVEAQSQVALDLRDAAMDSLAKAVAISGQFTEQAKKLLDNLYENKNKSLDGEDQFIASKKTELGL